ncbi:hypothetical protein [Leekyejoonella antrihumi]|uniref:Uncharacterized protein n=1 Tax=Leekyejoonella antrihumi TaxID=1660198 RepID=A0A563E096_9MICO|nr:hypothetical protein [Leekyejoonella antrihumi]TWP35799.1 hypothetical protein FGL98_12370 [Leekyejoonella antrihumi]
MSTRAIARVVGVRTSQAAADAEVSSTGHLHPTVNTETGEVSDDYDLEPDEDVLTNPTSCMGSTRSNSRCGSIPCGRQRRQ